MRIKEILDEAALKLLRSKVENQSLINKLRIDFEKTLNKMKQEYEKKLDKCEKEKSELEKEIKNNKLKQWVNLGF